MFEDGGIIRRIKKKGEGYSNPNEGATVESEYWSVCGGGWKGEPVSEQPSFFLPGKELLALHRLQVAVHHGGMQFHPSRGWMGWSGAGRAVIHCLPTRGCSSELSLGMAPAMALPELLARRVDWKTTSCGSSQAMMERPLEYNLRSVFLVVLTNTSLQAPELLSWWLGGGCKPGWGFGALPSPPDPFASNTVSKLLWDALAAKSLALPCLESISSQDVLP